MLSVGGYSLYPVIFNAHLPDVPRSRGPRGGSEKIQFRGRGPTSWWDTSQRIGCRAESAPGCETFRSPPGPEASSNPARLGEGAALRPRGRCPTARPKHPGEQDPWGVHPGFTGFTASPKGWADTPRLCWSVLNIVANTPRLTCNAPTQDPSIADGEGPGGAAARALCPKSSISRNCGPKGAP